MGKVRVLLFVGMVMAECSQVGLMIISKAAISDGMSNLVFVFYSNAIAALVLLPSSLLFHRSELPSLSFRILCGFFVLGLFGCFAQIFGYAGINYSSPTLGTTMLNLIPGLTFVMAIICRMEKVDWRSPTTLAKTVGTIASITGAFIVTLYKGPALLMSTAPSKLSYERLFLNQSNWVFGGLLLAADCILASAWIILQAALLKKFPAELIIVFFYCFFVALQSGLISLFFERDLSAWSLDVNRWIAVVYSAFFGSAFQVGVSTWCLHRAGPVFVAMFKPLGIVIAAFVEDIFLGETLYLGGLVGAIIIVAGFYSAMWGKAKEAKSSDEAGARSFETRGERASEESPLLQNYTEI